MGFIIGVVSASVVVLIALAVFLYFYEDKRVEIHKNLIPLNKSSYQILSTSGLMTLIIN